MARWYRVFGSLDILPTPAGIESCLGAEVSFRFDAEDWCAAESDGGSLHLERWCADEPCVRAELNAWAAYLETCDYSPRHVPLMERTIQTKQLFNLHGPSDSRFEGVCVALCRHLAYVTAGFYQIDGVGFFDAGGTLLVEEEKEN